MSKTQHRKKNAKTLPIKKGEIINKPNQGRGRPKGSLNKVTLALKEAILAAAEDVCVCGIAGKSPAIDARCV